MSKLGQPENTNLFFLWKALWRGPSIRRLGFLGYLKTPCTKGFNCKGGKCKMAKKCYTATHELLKSHTCENFVVF